MLARLICLVLPISLPIVIPQQCGIQSHGFKRGRITHPNCHTAEMRMSSRTPIRDLLAHAHRLFPSVHPKRHTAEMRYSLPLFPPPSRPSYRRNAVSSCKASSEAKLLTLLSFCTMILNPDTNVLDYHIMKNPS